MTSFAKEDLAIQAVISGQAEIGNFVHALMPGIGDCFVTIAVGAASAVTHEHPRPVRPQLLHVDVDDRQRARISALAHHRAGDLRGLRLPDHGDVVSRATYDPSTCVNA